MSYKTKHKDYIWHLDEVKEMTENKLELDKECSYYESLIGKENELAYSYRKKI